MEAENMVHSDSMSPATLGICEKLFRSGQRVESTSIKDAFINRLDEGIKDQLAPHAIPDDSEDLVDLTVWINNRLQEREAERRHSGSRSAEPQGAPWFYREYRCSSALLVTTADKAPPSGREKPI
ncbi:hypothetical protein L3Q82_005142 [Scortum barcoo]|uniref:Uncharacterized protein n=1 Tax=Scortum barcoo TaxID=214431 RepID=A0ACB8VEJ8_9TELE|nr:hypothetical protein L3Q82_005142 [Scortum barcoo]